MDTITATKTQKSSDYVIFIRNILLYINANSVTTPASTPKKILTIIPMI